MPDQCACAPAPHPDLHKIASGQLRRLRHQVRAAVDAAGQHVVEQVEIGEHRGEQLPVIVAPLVGDDAPVHQDLPLPRPIQAQQYLDQRGLAGAVVADNEDQLATLQAQIDRT